MSAAFSVDPNSFLGSASVHQQQAMRRQSQLPRLQKQQQQQQQQRRDDHRLTNMMLSIFVCFLVMSANSA